MALDGIFLYSIKNELDSIIGCKIDKVNQPEKDEIVLNIRGNKKNLKLLISASSNYPRIHFTKISKHNPQKAPMFCMILRKYLNGGKITSIKQIDTDRIIVINFENVDDLGFNSKYSLIVEIMGRRSNITLIRDRDNIIMDSIKHITASINTYRNVYPGLIYVYPPKSNKLNPFNFDLLNLKNFITQNNIEFSKKFFSNIFTGVSLQLSEEMFYELNISSFDLNTIYDFCSKFFENIKNNNFEFAYYINSKNEIEDFHCVSLKNLKNNCSKIICTTPSELLEDFYYKKDKLDRLKNKSADLQKLIYTNIVRCEKKIKILKLSLEKCKSKEKFKLYGELLTANIYNIKKGMEKCNVINYYNNEQVEINLNPNKTPSENVQFYYKKYDKLKTTEKMNTIQLKNAEDELYYLQSVSTNIENVENYDEIDSIRKELIETGYIKFKKSSKKNNKKDSKPLHFISSDNCDIYVGKNNLQNDYLTLKFAHKNDIWMHTKDVHGSHIIIKDSENLTDKTLEEGAGLAAYYSKGKDSSKVAVDYTRVKNVKKPSGAKPGMVIYYTNKTIFIKPNNSLKKIE